MTEARHQNPFNLIVLILAILSPHLNVLYLASAHGYVGWVTIDGTRYDGNVAGDPSPSSSAIYEVSDISPVKGADNKDLACGLGLGDGTNVKGNNVKANVVANANAGSKVEVEWVGGGGQNWPHNTGPMLTYLASCGSGDSCSDVNLGQLKWFKIQQVGRKAPGQEWAQADIMKRTPAILTLPSSLPSGLYLLRHEIIALHQGEALGGAEFYPSCTQIRVNNGGSGTLDQLLKNNEVTTFPGGYQDDDPGIWDKQVYNDNADYTFPGPPIASFVTNGGNSNSGSNSGSDNASSTTAKPSGATSTTSRISPSSTSVAGSGGLGGNGSGSGSQSQCRLVRTSSTNPNRLRKRDKEIASHRKAMAKRSTGLKGLRMGIRVPVVDGWVKGLFGA